MLVTSRMPAVTVVSLAADNLLVIDNTAVADRATSYEFVRVS